MIKKICKFAKTNKTADGCGFLIGVVIASSALAAFYHYILSTSRVGSSESDGDKTPVAAEVCSNSAPDTTTSPTSESYSATTRIHQGTGTASSTEAGAQSSPYEAGYHEGYIAGQRDRRNKSSRYYSYAPAEHNTLSGQDAAEFESGYSAGYSSGYSSALAY